MSDTRKMTRAEVQAYIAETFDSRIWKTADDKLQLRMHSRFEAEAVLAALQSLRPEARATIIEECARTAEYVIPRHTECGNKIARAIRALLSEPQRDTGGVPPPGASSDPDPELTKAGRLNAARDTSTEGK